MNVTVKIEGMSCKHCALRVEKALQGIEGVSAKVDLAGGPAELTPDGPIAFDLVERAVADAGYKAVR